ncbi:MAG: prepilin-type N-terminal cleavage/methylation domain-containing protein [Fimbriimonadaceae bacterium]|nr:prepilin-type N-terminal cleavage/methylation domain-containing protein [Fimbriimonadaceae bacterium]
MNKNRAFTLIELLVVIAIIAILAAILFPVFAQAKNAAKKATAISNVKQTSLGVLLYTNDYDDNYPMGSGACWWNPLDGGWALDTEPYIKNLPILRTPDDTLSKAGWQSWLTTHENGINISFAANGLIRWNGSLNENYDLMTMVQNQPETRCGPQNWMGNTIVSTTSVTNPSDTVMLAVRYKSQLTWGPGDFIAGVEWWDWTGHAGLLPDGSRNGNPYVVNGVEHNRSNRDGAVNAGFSGKSVFSFADGSAKALAPSATNPDETNRPELNKWNAKR